MIQSTDSVAYIYIFHIPMYIQSIFKELKYITNPTTPPPTDPPSTCFRQNGPFALSIEFIFPQLRDCKAQWILLV